MSAEDKFYQLWQSKKVIAAPSKDILMRNATSVKRGLRNQLIRTIISIVAGAAIIINKLMTTAPTMITTWIGVAMLFIGMILYIIYSTGLIKILNPAINLPVFEYIQHMQRIREKQRFVQFNIFKVYFLMLSLGFCLYTIEFTRRFSNTVQILIYTVLLCWIFISWFFIEKKRIKKQETVISDVIENFQSLSDEKSDK
ncbi:hypothetical protein DVR12_22715 [Chitinophaga silvatica]|uniref:Uncharacterized protein n=1 Tax=Chitinophaga silvatica TaxID=2282649 RepID=A0A3E1Y452_9BACT|nr:hypothetical protein [Chitinophaga silvatica]RFS19451.1 hypothetical protein DVR12_22715 [Chitinophaga silvatica]